MNIHGRRVVLRAPEMRDAELLHQWANDPELWRHLGGWHFPYASLSTQAWISAQAKGGNGDQVFCIEAPDAGVIGTANLVSIDWKNRNAFHGVMLGSKDSRGKGFALDAVMAVMRYAFDELGLMRLDSDIIGTNARSMDFYTRSCGWEIEGRRKNWFYRGGACHDKVIIGITREKYHRFVGDSGYWK